MKKAFVFGMVALTMTAQIAFAGPVKAPRELLTEHTKAMKEAILGKGGTAKNLKDVELDVAKDRIIKDLGAAADLKTALSGEAGKSRMDSLVTIIAIKQSLPNYAKVDAGDAQSMGAAADASVRFMAHSILVDTIPPKTLQGAELTLVREGMGKIETMPDQIMLQFSKAERDSYTQVLAKYDSIVTTSKGKLTAEEAFVQAIMEVKKVDRTKALEIVKKLKECV